jgi:hypothetical protein
MLRDISGFAMSSNLALSIPSQCGQRQKPSKTSERLWVLLAVPHSSQWVAACLGAAGRDPAHGTYACEGEQA